MLLKVLDRITLLGLLPEKGDFTTLKIVRQLREDLSFSEIEHELLSLQQTDGRLTWNPQADEGKEVEIGAKASVLIEDQLKKLDKEKQLTSQHMSVYEMFVKE